jgi:hypothetical protein
MEETVVLEPQFRGPPGSANGGYTCGVTAAPLSGQPVEVTLRLPPPLDLPLTRATTPEGVELRDGDAVIAAARHSELDLEAVDPVPFETARAGSEEFDVEDYERRHPFPSCFVCGPTREPGDGLRIFPARIARDYPMVAWPWEPHGAFVDDDGLVREQVLWAALDCPSGLTRVHEGTAPAPHVLGRLTVDVRRRPGPDERLVVAGWETSEEGRKRFSGSALWSEDGEVLAASRAVWIMLTDEQSAAFTGRA